MGGARLLKLWDPVPEGSFSSLRGLTNDTERTLDLPKRRSRHGTSPWLSTEQLLGPFEEEEEEEGRVHQKDHVDVTDFLYILNH